MQVLALFKQVMAQLGENPAVPFLEAVQAVSEAISRVLIDKQSDMVKRSCEFAVGPGATVLLPEDFAGFRCLPYCSENRLFLRPLSDETELSSTGTTLQYYDQRGFNFSLFPQQAVAKTVKIIYHGTPTPLVDMSDDLPFDGMFDFLFKDAVVRVAMDGISITSDRAFRQYMESRIGEVQYNRVPTTFVRNGYFD